MKVIYRSRQPVKVGDATGYLDFWTPSEARARAEADKAEGRIFEALTEEQISELSPQTQLRARAAMETAYSK